MQLLHCLRDYVASSAIWHGLGFHTTSFFFQVDAISWLREETSKDSVNMFLAGVWWIWRSRNSSCLAHDTISVAKSVLFANRRGALLTKCFLVAGIIGAFGRTIAWHDSREDVIVFNVDGSF